MDSLWEAIGRGRQGVIARGEAFVRRTRETSAELLERAEREASKLHTTVSSRRSSLNGKPIERLEKQILARVEGALARVGIGLRTQIQRIAPGPKHAAIEPSAKEQPEEATLVTESEAPAETAPAAVESPPRAVSARAARKPIRVAVESVAATAAEPAANEEVAAESAETVAEAVLAEEPVAEAAAAEVEPATKKAEPANARKTLNGQVAPKRAKVSAKATKKSERPAARRNGKTAAAASERPSTRWVTANSEAAIADLQKLNSKQLLARIPHLDEPSVRALLENEQATRNRKAIVDALTSRLPS